MSATISQVSIHHVPGGSAGAPRSSRLGASDEGGGPGLQWLLKRNCSLRPRQLLMFYLSLCVLSLLIASGFWQLGATLVMPFAGLEIMAIGSALLLYAHHAADNERISLQPGRLTVEHVHGRHVERVEFAPAWVRIEPAHGDGSLIELSGQGRRIAIGRFVRPELRRQLADDLRRALRSPGL